MSEYKVTEKDVDVVVRYMKLRHPEKADPTYCREMLGYIKSGLHTIARHNPDDIEAMYAQFEKQTKKKNA